MKGNVYEEKYVKNDFSESIRFGRRHILSI